MRARTTGLLAAAAVMIAVVLWDATRLRPDPETEFDCPHDPGTLTLAGDHASIPEYNDCQRFIDETGTTYRERVGIYVAEALGDITLPQPTQCASNNTALVGGLPVACTRGSFIRLAVAVAVVRSWDTTDYAPLGIKPGYNCFYLLGPTALTPANLALPADAIMYKVNEQGECAPGVKAASDIPGVPLKVSPVPQKVAPVGRWGWDPDSRTQYIAMACPGGWCRVTAELAEPGESIPLPTEPVEAKYTARPMNDLQLLAVEGGGDLVPGTAWALAVPEAGASLDVERLSTWQHVASLAISDNVPAYAEKLNLVAGATGDNMTRVELCGAKWLWACGGQSLWALWTAVKSLRCPKETTTGKRWFNRITSHDPEVGVSYHCATREAHDAGVAVPGTVRWRWIAKDETLWTPCGPGCCRVNTDEF